MKNLRGLPVGLCVLVAILTLSPLAAAQPSRFRLDSVASWGGEINGFQRVGNYGVCGRGQRLVVLDMTNEANIHEVGSVDLTVTVEDVLVRGTYAYVLTKTYPYPFSVIDVSVPTAPRMIWHDAYPSYARPSTRLRSYGNLPYLVYPSDGEVYAYDLTNPVAPVLIETGPLGSHYYGVQFCDASLGCISVADLRIVGHYAYLVGGNDTHGNVLTFAVFDLQPDPVHPAIAIGAVVLPGAPGFSNRYRTSERLAVDGGRVVLQRQWYDSDGVAYGVMELVDATDPAHPAAAGMYTDFFDARTVAVQGNLA